MAQKWYQKASVQAAIVSGLLLIIATAVPYALRVPALNDKIEDLKKESQEKSNEILRLEAQIAPFRALAIEKYPGDQAEALNKLAQEVTTLSERLERAERLINRFQVRVKMTISANWSAAKPNNAAFAVLPGMHPSLILIGSKIDKAPDVVLFSTESRTTEAPEDELGVLYVAEPKAGAPPLGMSIDSLSVYETANFAVPFVTISAVSDGKATLRMFELEILINGMRRFSISKNPNYTFDLPTDPDKIKQLKITLSKSFWDADKVAGK